MNRSTSIFPSIKLPSLIPERLGLHLPPVFRHIHGSYACHAVPLPNTAAGPPPAAPLPAASQYGERVDRRRRQAAALKQAKDLRAEQTKPGSAMMKKRFWKEVHVKTDEDTNLNVYLDSRPLRNPATKTPVPIPASKPHLATAIALEWDLLTSNQQALRSHLIPLTSMAYRAHDLAIHDASSEPSSTRADLVNMLMRYLDTDTLLCWAPALSSSSPSVQTPGEGADTDSASSLRDLQISTARPIISYLTTHIWPGVDIVPTLSESSIFPTPQPEPTRAVIKGWIAGLSPWEIAGLERAVLAGKSLLVGARLVYEWSGMGSLIGRNSPQAKRFGVNDACEACSVEVRWQTGRWGEVEDSHDVEKEDLRRQFGSVVLTVTGSDRGP